ncbi:MAG: peptide deformylase [Bacteroidales bacterium]|jgi:peptide deformylase|nr:peptide deformylase [Bacteroidales bacterium]MCI2146352.1 peptide deformylase [Bacteroidales bacterium]
MILPIYLYGSQVLREKAKPVDLTDKPEEIRQFIKDLYETMHHADGCGLAAPQVGRSIRVLVVDGNDMSDQFPELKGFHRAMVNPEVVRESETMVQYSEGCLSIPDIDAAITRPDSITVRYYDEELRQHEETFDVFACRMVEHELDHLEGIMFTDKATPIRKKILANKLRGISNGHVRCSYKVRTDKKLL